MALECSDGEKARGMYTDFTSLKKACPKDNSPLSSIDRLIDMSFGNKLMSFMDAFSGYNQISIAPKDQEKMAFVTKENLFCNRVMPFSLKNTGADYQRLVNKIFR